MKKPLEPSPDCPFCPRLKAFRAENRRRQPDWFNAPVPSFGPLDARILIAGLAPGLSGANRTGRPFTGDWAGDLLYGTLLKLGLAKGTYEERAGDSLELLHCRIANSVRCVPPENRPQASEIRTCRQFLNSELATLPNIKVILALGRIAHDSVCDALEARKKLHPFKHGMVYETVGKYTLISSYHCSRYNTNTGVLTPEMFEEVAARAKTLAAIS
ncbi:MAG: uracil-DNA glycosylase [Rhizomicrobium sp.]